MNPNRLDFSIFDGFNFERKMVAIKFLFDKPEGIPRLNKNMRICEMLREAQEGATPFYADNDNFLCAGRSLLGLVDIEDITPSVSGRLATALEIFNEPRAAQKLPLQQPTLPRNTANYIAFTTTDKLPFDPDVLIITAKLSQTEILLRASTYTQGKVWTHKIMPYAACAWVYVYPYTSGELNYTVTGLSFGMKAHEVFPEGLWLVSIPYNLLPTVIQNLKDMKWVPTAYQLGKEKFEERLAEIHAELKR
jgi:uncharacterized protein (DUF169 family)